MATHPGAGKRPDPKLLESIPHLVAAYYTEHPDPSVTAQSVRFGTSGHRGSSLDRSFNEDHVVAICAAVVEERTRAGIDGPLFVGTDTHGLSEPAQRTALEVFAAHDVAVHIEKAGHTTPTPSISRAILRHNKGRTKGLADGVVITPSHNPPRDGGFKYNPAHGGPAEGDITKRIAKRANDLMQSGLQHVKRQSYTKALHAATAYDFVTPYVEELAGVLNLEAIAGAKLKIAADPMGGAGLPYWEPIAARYGLDITVVNREVDARFAFMPLDRDGKIRMDCSSAYAMANLLERAQGFDIALGNDTDFDRHGIVTRTAGLMNPNHYLAVAIDHLLQHRPNWSNTAAIGKTLVSSGIIDRVVAARGRTLCEVPVGFKWFVDGLHSGKFAFGGEESAGASFAQKDGSVWSTDKDGILLALLAAEITAVQNRDPSELYAALTEKFGAPVYARTDAPADDQQKAKLAALTPDAVSAADLAGDKITAIYTEAPGNNAKIGGLKVETDNGWFAARPSGTEAIYKIYAESFVGEQHLVRIQEEAQALVLKTLAN